MPFPPDFDLVPVADLSRPQPAPDHPDRRVGALAARQHGRVSRRQLLGLGLSARQIAGRVRSGRLIVVHAGVYAVGHATPGSFGACAAAVLAYAPGAAVSHRSAAALHGLRASGRDVVDITITRHGRSRRRGIDLHRSRTLESSAVVRIQGLLVTSVARTYVDCAAVLRPAALAKMWREGIHRELLQVSAIEAELQRGRAGTAAIRELLADREVVPVLRSELEELAWRVIRSEQLACPQANVWLPAIAGGIEVDLIWPHERLVVELDGWRVHGTYRAFHADRTRDALLQLAGLRVVRLTWRHLRHERAASVQLLRRFLGA
jgi:very-short-patch-repair endonuclease